MSQFHRDKFLYALETATRDVTAIVGDGSGLSHEDFLAVMSTVTTVNNELSEMMRKMQKQLLGEKAQLEQTMHGQSGPTGGQE